MCCYNCSVEIKGHFHVYSAQEKGTLNLLYRITLLLDFYAWDKEIQVIYNT